VVVVVVVVVEGDSQGVSIDSVRQTFKGEKVGTNNLCPNARGGQFLPRGSSSRDERCVTIAMGPDKTLLQGKVFPMHSCVSMRLQQPR